MSVIVRNVALNMIRADRPTEPIDDLDIPVAPVDPPDSRLGHCLKQLPADQRNAIVLTYTYRLTHSELAEHISRFRSEQQKAGSGGGYLLEGTNVTMTDKLLPEQFAIGLLSPRERADATRQRLCDAELDLAITNLEATLSPLAGMAGCIEPPAGY